MPKYYCTAVIKAYNIKRHYCTKHTAKYDGIELQLRFDEIKQLKKSLSMLEVFQSYEKDTELVAELNFEILEVIAEKRKAYSDSEFIKNCLEEEMCCGATKSVSVYRSEAKR